MTRMALAALIDDTETRNDWRDTDVAKRGTTDDTKLGKTDVSNYRLYGMKTIVPRKITALARGLGLPPYRVALAVLEDAGITVPMDIRTPELAIEHDHTLSEHTRRALLLLLKEDRNG